MRQPGLSHLPPQREGPPPVTHDDSIAELLLGAAVIALLFVVAFILIPVLVS